jgi:hypothetical protein
MLTASLARWARDPDLAKAVAVNISVDVDDRLIHRLTADMFDFPDPSKLANDPAGAREEAWPNRRYPADDAAVEGWVAAGATIERLRAVLDDAATITAQVGQRAIRGEVMVALGERRRDLITRLVLEEWDELSLGVHDHLVLAAIRLLPDEIAATVARGLGAGPVGLPGALLRFFDHPDEHRGASAGLLAHFGRFILPLDRAPLWLTRLAAHPDSSVGQQVQWWLRTWVERGSPDLDDLVQVVRRLVAAPHGFGHLASISGDTRERLPWTLDERPALEGVLLDALATHLPSLRDVRTGAVGEWDLQPLVARYLRVRPAEAWGLSDVLGPRFGESPLLELVDTPTSLPVLHAAPPGIVDAVDGSTAKLFDYLVRRLDPQAWADEVQGLLAEGPILLALRWAVPRGDFGGHLDLLVELLDLVPEAGVDSLVTAIVRGRWHAGLSAEAQRVEPFAQSPAYEPPDIVVDLRRRAHAVDARVAARIEELATAIEEEARDEHEVRVGLSWPR